MTATLKGDIYYIYIIILYTFLYILFNMLEVFSISNARNDFLPLINRVKGGFYSFMVTKHGRPVAVVLSYEEYSRMVETLKIIEDRELMHDIKQSASETEPPGMIKLDQAGEEVE